MTGPPSGEPFRDGHTETWWAADARLGWWGPDGNVRLIVATTDPATLPPQATWYLATDLPRPGGLVLAGHLAELASALHAAYVQVAAGLPCNTALEVAGGKLKQAKPKNDHGCCRSEQPRCGRAAERVKILNAEQAAAH
ncbi:hypothetical protein ACFRCI_37145 [Streptomyces sp. NPDC056638]|uniref:hypothetical protein n=1 Tax=Streptomyces sp. NPDC056638 TaxID=3345887 RepID=UPI003676140D